nr:COGs COG0840 [Kibdelosporangium sp. MJ126-NF4]CTQ88742.1 COGs COG0840 [Kibdelosporangium sp. MJ126-NF4]
MRGLEPAATPTEIEAAARQYVRKISGVQSLSDATREAFEQAVAEVTATTTRLLEKLPARRQPPTTVPPLRRPEVQARLAAKNKSA